MYAAFMGHPSTMILLIENGADVNLMNDKKQTIMDYFDRWEDEAIIKLLEGRFDYKAREDEKKLKAQRRQDVLQLLKDWRTRGNEAIILNSC
jgi:ankyrin repeat protein